jgi:multicomponent Na+:H+ antiporter subunit D
VVDAAVNGVAGTALKSGNLLRRIQTGIVSHYGLMVVLGLIVVVGVYFLVAKGVL